MARRRRTDRSAKNLHPPSPYRHKCRDANQRAKTELKRPPFVFRLGFHRRIIRRDPPP